MTDLTPGVNAPAAGVSPPARRQAETAAGGTLFVQRRLYGPEGARESARETARTTAGERLQGSGGKKKAMHPMHGPFLFNLVVRGA